MALVGCAADDSSSSSMLGAAGGTVSSAGAQVVIPPGALGQDTPIAVAQTDAGAPALPQGVHAFGSIFAFTPHGTSFATAVTMTVPFDPASVPSGATPKLYKTNAAQSAWAEVPGATVDGNTMTGQVTGFSFAVVAGAASPDGLFVSGLDPDHGRVDAVVTLTGGGFSPSASDDLVVLNGKPCKVRAATATQLSVEVPAQAGSGNFEVMVHDATAESPMFTYELTSVTVSTFAGGQIGYQDGAATDAKFRSLAGVVLTGSGGLLVTDSGNHMIRAVSAAGVVTTFSGSTEGSADGTVGEATYHRPAGLAFDFAGNLFVADMGSNAVGESSIREITPGGVVNTIRLSNTSLFSGVATDPAGNVYVTDMGESSIDAIDASLGMVTTLAGGAAGDADGVGSQAKFFFPVDLTSCGENLFLADMNNMKIKKIAPGGEVSTYTGAGSGVSYVDGSLADARFLFPDGVACDHDGKLFVSDGGNFRIRMITPSGVVTTLAGSQPQIGGPIIDGDGATATFSVPAGIAVDDDGTLYVADGPRIRKIVWR